MTPKEVVELIKRSGSRDVIAEKFMVIFRWDAIYYSVDSQDVSPVDKITDIIRKSYDLGEKAK